MTLRKATREEYDRITRVGIQILKMGIDNYDVNHFITWKDWINENFNFGEDRPSLSRIVKEVLEID